MERLDEGYYRDANGIEYKSIWRFKIDEGFSEILNTTTRNAEEANALKIECLDKTWSDFNLSTNYKEGYAYSVDCLSKFYRDKPRKKKIVIKKS